MRVLLIGAVSAAILTLAGPAAAQYPPPPPPPSDSDQYGPRQGPDDDQDQTYPDDQGGPEQRDDSRTAPPPPMSGQDQGRYAPPPQDRYDQPRPRQGYGPPPGQGAGADYEPADVLVQREDMLEQRIRRMVRRGKLDPHTADDALGELRAIQDEQDRLASRGLSADDQSRLDARLDDLQRRVKSAKRR